MPTLKIHEATVQTVQVEIKALKVGKKQVTMGMFRQLPRATLLDPETVQLRGIPWGHVNYWWEGDGSGLSTGARRHIVWQAGESLRRDVVFEDPSPHRMRDYQARHQEMLNDWVVCKLAQAQSYDVLKQERFDQQVIELDGHNLPVTLESKVLHVLRNYWTWRDRDPLTQAEAETLYLRERSPDRYAETLANAHAFQTQSKHEALEAYAALLHSRGLATVPVEQIRHGIRALDHERDAYKAQWAQQWQTLCDLPQLFIAV